MLMHATNAFEHKLCEVTAVYVGLINNILTFPSLFGGSVVFLTCNIICHISA